MKRGNSQYKIKIIKNKKLKIWYNMKIISNIGKVRQIVKEKTFSLNLI